MTNTDRIERRVVERAPRTRVWRALTTAKEFGAWFGIDLAGEFAAGATIRGRMVPPDLNHVTLEFQVERIEPERYFSYRWHPYPFDPAVDYSRETPTLVEFTLQDAEGSTAVTVVETGFDRIPLARRAEAFRKHRDGWVEQIENLVRYVVQVPNIKPSHED